jgi:hypothetical protein
MNYDSQFDEGRNDSFGTVPKSSDGFGNVRNDSETFGKLPNISEGFGNVPKISERKEYCTLTVREAARLFEAAGVARTERSIINWCQPNKQGLTRLDNYFDPNERKYFISQQSVDLAIEEEKAKAVKGTESSEPVTDLPNHSEIAKKSGERSSEDSSERGRQVETEIMNLKILNSGKDFLIQQLRQERDSFFNQLLDSSRKVGELETRLLQLPITTRVDQGNEKTANESSEL